MPKFGNFAKVRGDFSLTTAFRLCLLTSFAAYELSFALNDGNTLRSGRFKRRLGRTKAKGTPRPRPGRVVGITVEAGEFARTSHRRQFWCLRTLGKGAPFGLARLLCTRCISRKQGFRLLPGASHGNSHRK